MIITLKYGLEKTLLINAAKSEEETKLLEKKLKETDEEFEAEKNRLKRKMEDESSTKSNLQRKLKSLEDEHDTKQVFTKLEF